MKQKELSRQRRRIRVRKRVFGNMERPRLSVFRSLNHIYAQVIDDTKGLTLVSASTISEEFKAEKGHRGNIASAKKVGLLLSSKAVQAGIKRVVFDKGGYKYHGSIKAVADAAREGGMEF
ncbi:MAG: 50S ribosomal protein L18 [Nitrospirae bacterium]|nr:50S ribosomal protein L18 [Nitrospirota bacterium]